MMRTSCVCLFLAIAAQAADWPSFRGPNASGVSADAGFPAEWTAEKNVAWKAKLPGRGWSCPVIVNDRVYLTSASSEIDGKQPAGGRPMGGGGGGGRGVPTATFKFEVHCLDLATGKPVWTKLARESKPTIATHGSNTYATETPVVDGGKVFAYFGMHGLYCFDLDGKELWKRDLGSFPMTNGWGTASSPAAAEGRVFVQVDNEEKSFLVALDAKTGEDAWRVAREERTNWSTPVVWKNKSRTELVTVGAGKSRSYDPATGKVLWELSMGAGRSSSSATCDAERVYFGLDGGGGGGKGGPMGKGGPGGGGGGRGEAGTLFAVKAGATGDITPKAGETKSDGVAWSRPKAGPQMASPIAFDGLVYVFSRNGGLVSCYDAASGEPKYEKERLSGASEFWASPWAADGKVYALDSAGVTHVLKAGPTFDVVGTNKLSDTTWATPAVSGSTLLIRGTAGLYAVRK